MEELRARKVISHKDTGTLFKAHCPLTAAPPSLLCLINANCSKALSRLGSCWPPPNRSRTGCGPLGTPPDLALIGWGGGATTADESGSDSVRLCKVINNCSHNQYKIPKVNFPSPKMRPKKVQMQALRISKLQEFTSQCTGCTSQVQLQKTWAMPDSVLRSIHERSQVAARTQNCCIWILSGNHGHSRRPYSKHC